MAENTTGVSVPLSADVRKALADLQSVADQARMTKAELAGLPAPAGASRPSNHPLVAPMPGANIPGGKASGIRTPVVVGTEAPDTPGQKLANERGVKYVYGNTEALRGTGNAATKLAASPGVPQPVVPSPSAGGAANQGAFAAQQDRLARQLMEGPKLTSGGPKLGPISLGALGGGLSGVFMKTLGPAAGYAAVAHIGLKTLESATGFMADAVEQAARTGRPVDEVLFDKTVQALSDLPTAVAAGTVGALSGASKTVLNILGATADLSRRSGLSGALMAVPGGLPVALLAGTGDPRLLTEAAKGKIDDLLAWLEGRPDRKQQARNAQSDFDRTMDLLRAKAQQMVEKNQERVADQLVGAGFPGTFDQIKGNPHVHQALSDLANEAVHEDRQRAQREYSKLTTGKQE